MKYKISNGTNNEISQNVKGAKIHFDNLPEMKPKYKFQKMSDQVNEPIYKEIEKLKQEGVIKETHHEDRNLHLRYLRLLKKMRATCSF